jgi:hypothetical protein
MGGQAGVGAYSNLLGSNPVPSSNGQDGNSGADGKRGLPGKLV